MIGKKMVRSAELCSGQSEGIKKIGIGGNRLIIAWNRGMNRRLEKLAEKWLAKRWEKGKTVWQKDDWQKDLPWAFNERAVSNGV